MPNDTRLAITGGRDYSITQDDLEFLSRVVQQFPSVQILSGGARGADAAVENWARQHGHPIVRLLPDWKAGRLAGLANNERIARSADVLVAFPGGRGTSHMVRYCRSINIPVIESDSRKLAESEPPRNELSQDTERLPQPRISP